MKTENMPITGQGFTHSENSQSDITGNDFAAIVPVICGQIGGRENNIVSAKSLHKALGAGRDFTNWIKGQISQYGFIASAALDVARAEEGKQTFPRHYTNESNMIARIVLGGLTAKQWAQVNGIAGVRRDAMNAVQLEHLTYLESTNITMIDMGMTYDQRKAELMRLSQRWLAKHLGADHD